MDIWQLEKMVLEYCQRNEIRLKKTYRNNDAGAFFAESFDAELLEAYIGKAGRVVFKLNGKRTSIYQKGAGEK